MIKYLASFLLFTNILFAQNTDLIEKEIVDNTEENNPKVDCLILDDENSIICKIEIQGELEDKNIIVNWIDPDGNISRTREIIIPAGDKSVYDYRYIEGRELGKWEFKALYNEKEFSTSFELK